MGYGSEKMRTASGSFAGLPADGQIWVIKAWR